MEKNGRRKRGRLEESLAVAEGGETCVAFATGMAAVAAATGVVLKTGDEIVAHQTLYGCTYSLFTEWLPRFGITTRFADLRDYRSFYEAITPRARAVYFETPFNPTPKLIDIQEVRVMMDELAAGRDQRGRMLMIVDNTFANPFCRHPLELGADLVVRRLSKDVAGFGACAGGAVIGAKGYRAPLLLYREAAGSCASPRGSKTGTT